MSPTVKRLESLPELITLAGIAITRSVFIDDKPLLIKKSLEIKQHYNSYDWGWDGPGAAQLALAICLRYFTKNQALSVYEDLASDLLANITESNFIVEIKFRELLHVICGRFQEPKPIEYFLDYKEVKQSKVPEFKGTSVSTPIMPGDVNNALKAVGMDLSMFPDQQKKVTVIKKEDGSYDIEDTK